MVQIPTGPHNWIQNNTDWMLSTLCVYIHREGSRMIFPKKRGMGRIFKKISNFLNFWPNWFCELSKSTTNALFLPKNQRRSQNFEKTGQKESSGKMIITVVFLPLGDRLLYISNDSTLLVECREALNYIMVIVLCDRGCFECWVYGLVNLCP